MDVRTDLLTEIEAFLAQHGGMAETTFGRLAVNDGKLISRLRNGSNMTIATIDRVRSFLRTQATSSAPPNRATAKASAKPAKPALPAPPPPAPKRRKRTTPPPADTAPPKQDKAA